MRVFFFNLLKKCIEYRLFLNWLKCVHFEPPLLTMDLVHLLSKFTLLQSKLFPAIFLENGILEGKNLLCKEPPKYRRNKI